MGADGRVFLVRQPILDARTRVVGHEILYRDAQDASAAVIEDVSQVMTASSQEHTTRCTALRRLRAGRQQIAQALQMVPFLRGHRHGEF